MRAERTLNFAVKITCLVIFRLELKKTTVLRDFASAPSNFSKHKILSKNKNP